MISAIGVPVVKPSKTPEKISTLSGSFLEVVTSDFVWFTLI